MPREKTSGLGNRAVQIHLRIEELLQWANLHALFLDVCLQPGHPHFRGDDHRRGRLPANVAPARLRMICIRPVCARVDRDARSFSSVAIHTYLLLAFLLDSTLLVGLLFVGWGNLELYPDH